MRRPARSACLTRLTLRNPQHLSLMALQPSRQCRKRNSPAPLWREQTAGSRPARAGHGRLLARSVVRGRPGVTGRGLRRRSFPASGGRRSAHCCEVRRISRTSTCLVALISIGSTMRAKGAQSGMPETQPPLGCEEPCGHTLMSSCVACCYEDCARAAPLPRGRREARSQSASAASRWARLCVLLGLGGD